MGMESLPNLPAAKLVTETRVGLPVLRVNLPDAALGQSDPKSFKCFGNDRTAVAPVLAERVAVGIELVLLADGRDYGGNPAKPKDTARASLWRAGALPLWGRRKPERRKNNLSYDRSDDAQQLVGGTLHLRIVPADWGRWLDIVGF